jgi:hypothetical protein
MTEQRALADQIDALENHHAAAIAQLLARAEAHAAFPAVREAYLAAARVVARVPLRSSV